MAYYMWYRHKQCFPVFRSSKHGSDVDQPKILVEIGDLELYRQFRIQVERKKHKNRSTPMATLP